MTSGWRSREPCALTPSGIGLSSVVATIQSLTLAMLPRGAPVTAQPSRGSPSASKEVLPSPVETSMSSTATPGSWYTSSLA